MNEEDKELQKQLVDEMMKVSKTNPDVMIYMQSLMKCYEDLEKENENLKQQLDFIGEQNKYIDKIEKMTKDYKSRNEKAIEFIKENDGYAISRNYYDKKLLNILQGGDE